MKNDITEALPAINEAIRQLEVVIGHWISHPGFCMDAVQAAFDALTKHVTPNVVGSDPYQKSVGWLASSVATGHDSVGWYGAQGSDWDIKQSLMAIRRDLYDIRDEIAWNHNSNDHLNATPR